METSWFALRACLLAASMALGLGCDEDGGDDEGGDEGPGATSSADGEGDGADEGGPACGDACASLADDAQCAMDGFDAAACVDACSSSACAACLAESEACGSDCEAVCAGGGSSADGSSADGSSDDGDPPQCTTDDECGISFECVACGLNDAEGWCEQTMACSFDQDCGSGGKCGYNVQSGDYRCVPGGHCG